MRKVVPPDHPFLALALYEWAEYRLEQGDVQQAEEALREVARMPRPAFPPGNMRPLGQALAALGWVLTRTDHAKEGEPMLREGLKFCRQGFGEGHWAIAEAQSRLGGCLAALGQYGEAEKLLLESYKHLESAARTPPPRFIQAAERIVQLYKSWGKPDKAAEWRAKLPAPPGGAQSAVGPRKDK
jgi:tetratricopeptide (TPR) repeat protein